MQRPSFGGTTFTRGSTRIYPGIWCFITRQLCRWPPKNVGRGFWTSCGGRSGRIGFTRLVGFPSRQEAVHDCPCCTYFFWVFDEVHVFAAMSEGTRSTPYCLRISEGGPPSRIVDSESRIVTNHPPRLARDADVFSQDIERREPAHTTKLTTKPNFLGIEGKLGFAQCNP